MWKYEELRKTLAALYYTQGNIIDLLIRANLSPGDYVLNGGAGEVWTLLVKKLENQGKLKQLVAKALEEYPENKVFVATMEDQPAIAKSAYSGEQPAWKGTPSKLELEKIMGKQSTLLPISFLEMGMVRANAVGKVLVPGGSGTGFLISADNLFLTNNHVLESKDVAGESKVQFNYQMTLKGLSADSQEFEIDNSEYKTSVTDDWSIVRLKGDPAAKYGFIPLSKTKVKKEDFVNIIQHPGGELKQIAMYHNVVTYVDDRVVQYLTDTMPGSSGAPVFNSKWDVVALHHSGGWIEEPNSATEVLRNEGILISRVADALRAHGFNV